MRLDRRTFLELAAGLGLVSGASLLPRRLGATEPTVTDQYFVFAYFGGGWDMLLGLDPRDPGEFTPERAPVTGIDPGYADVEDLDPSDWFTETTIDGMTFGPFIGDLAAHAGRLAVLRGMTMESVAHEVARRHAVTGKRPAGSSVRGSSVATLLAYLLGENEPIPNLVCGTNSFNVGHPSWATGLVTETVDDLFQALSPGEVDVGDATRDALESFYATQETRTVSPKALQIYANRRAARDMVDLGLADIFDLAGDGAEMGLLRQAFGVDSAATGVGGPRALMAAQALTHGVSRCVTFQAADGLDTHQGAQWRADHGPNLRAGFDSVAALATHLASKPFGDSGASWLDHTTIVCLSEFSREALRNSNGGRDHNLINTMAMLGGPIRGGQVIGETTDEGMQAQAVDLATGEVSGSGDLLTNEHVARTLLASLGIEDDIGDFRQPSIGALLEGV